MNYAFQKANKVANQQAHKYKASYDKSIRGPQLQEKDIVLVKIVAHKGRHKLQDKWEPEEYVVVEQPIAGTPVYRVQPITGGNIRTLCRNLLLPLGVKLEPDYDSDDSILEEDDSSSDESIVPGDTKTEVYDRKRCMVPFSNCEQFFSLMSGEWKGACVFVYFGECCETVCEFFVRVLHSTGVLCSSSTNMLLLEVEVLLF